MRTRQQTFLIKLTYVAIDLCCMWVVFYTVFMLRRLSLPFPITLEGFFSTANPFKMLFVVWPPLILIFNQIHGLYQTNREQRESIEIWEVVKSVVSATFLAIVAGYLMKITDFPRSVMLLSGCGITVSMALWRIIKKLIVSYFVRRGYNNFNTVIIGAGKVGTLLAEEIAKHPSLGINIIGFLDDFKKGPVGSKKWPVLGGIDAFEDIARREFINKVFITIYHNSGSFVKILEQARARRVAVRVVPQGYEWITQEATKYNVGIIPVLAYSDVDVNYRLRTKRVFDMAAGLLIAVVLIPFIMLIAVLIKIDSRGPVFYLSRRYGQQGRMFNMIKFRSMVCNAHDMLKVLKDKNEVGGPIFKMRCDPRVTKIGAWLRKYSLDELPQIFNVIIGDMSLVGPRPLPIEQIEKEDLRQLKRLDIRPGITGLWQIKGRSDVSFDRLIRWDIWYINNWSFALDMHILWQTIPVVIKGRGAY